MSRIFHVVKSLEELKEKVPKIYSVLTQYVNERTREEFIVYDFKIKDDNAVYVFCEAGEQKELYFILVGENGVRAIIAIESEKFNLKDINFLLLVKHEGMKGDGEKLFIWLIEYLIEQHKKNTTFPDKPDIVYWNSADKGSGKFHNFYWRILSEKFKDHQIEIIEKRGKNHIFVFHL